MTNANGDSSLIWILPSTSGGSVDSGPGLSSEYRVPLNVLKSNVSDFSGRYLWLVLRHGRLDLVCKLLYIDDFVRDEEIADDSVIFNISMHRSFKIARHDSKSDQLLVPEGLTSGYSLGLHTLNAETESGLVSCVKSKIATKISFPNLGELSSISCSDNFVSPDAIIRDLFASISQKYSLSDLYGGVDPPGFDKAPYAFFVFHMLRRIDSGIPRLDEDFVARLLQLDPVVSLSNVTGSPPIKTVDRKVDLNRKRVDPEEVKSRNFTKLDIDLDTSDSLEKLRRAESAHQALLANLSSELIAMELTPYETASIDLLVERQESIFIFEIKSVCEDNLERQVSKGLFQLLKYRHALKVGNDKPIYLALFIENNISNQAKSFIAEVLKPSGVQLLFGEIAAVAHQTTPGLVEFLAQ